MKNCCLILSLSSLLLVQALLGQQPVIVRVDKLRNEIAVDTWNEITVVAQNISPTASPEGYITASFPSFDFAFDINRIQNNSSSAGNPGYYQKAAGEQIWHRGEYQFAAERVLAEYGTTNWESQGVRNLKFKIQPKSTGAFYMYIRSTMKSATDDTFISYPEAPSAVTDQQGWPAQRYFFTVIDEPLEPDNPTPADGAVLGSSPNKLEWDQPKWGHTYDVFLKGPTTFGFQKVKDDTAGPEHPFIGGLLPGVYEWYVVARNVAGTTTSDTWTFTLGDPPETFSLLSPADESTYPIAAQPTLFDWEDADDATEYEIYIDADDPIPNTKIATVTNSEWTPTLSLATGTYNWRVMAINQFDTQWSTETWSFTIADAGSITATLENIATSAYQPQNVRWFVGGETATGNPANLGPFTPGTGRVVKAWQNGGTPWGEEQWVQSATSIASAHEDQTFTRNLPHNTAQDRMLVNEDYEFPFGLTIPTTSSVQLALTFTSPDVTRTIRLRTLIDRDRAFPWDLDITTVQITIPAGDTDTITFYPNTDEAGNYEYTYLLEWKDGDDWIPVDSSPWIEMFSAAPAEPINIPMVSYPAAPDNNLLHHEQFSYPRGLDFLDLFPNVAYSGGFANVDQDDVQTWRQEQPLRLSTVSWAWAATPRGTAVNEQTGKVRIPFQVPADGMYQITADLTSEQSAMAIEFDVYAYSKPGYWLTNAFRVIDLETTQSIPLLNERVFFYIFDKTTVDLLWEGAQDLVVAALTAGFGKLAKFAESTTQGLDAGIEVLRETDELGGGLKDPDVPAIVNKTIDQALYLEAGHSYAIELYSFAHTEAQTFGLVTYQLTSTESLLTLNNITIRPTLAAIPIPTPPSDLALSSAVVAEEQALGQQVGLLSALAPSGTDSLTFELIPGEGGSDNELFAIAGNRLLTASTLDFEIDHILELRIRATDRFGHSTEENFIVTVADIEEPVLEVDVQSFDIVVTGSAGGRFPIQISNSGAGELRYVIQENVDWLSLSSASGVSNGETDTIEIIVDSSELAAGVHTTEIFVGAGPETEVVSIPFSIEIHRPPVAETGLPTSIQSTSVYLNGIVTPNGPGTTAEFEYGPTTAYGSIASVTLSPDDGSVPQPVSANLSGLQPGQVYHFRLSASNGEGTSHGDDVVFATESVSGDYRYTMTNGEVTITGYTGAGGDVSIPAMIGGMPVVRIGSRAFLGENFTRVTLPEGVTTIDDSAFQSCRNLNIVSLPSTLTSIGERAFYYNTGLTAAVFAGSPPALGRYGFSSGPDIAIYYEDSNSGWPSPTWEGKPTYHGGELDSFIYRVLGETVEIATYPKGATGQIGIPSTIDGRPVTSIGEEAFEGCRSLTGITLPGTIANIGRHAFSDCSGLSSVSIPGNGTIIGDYAFDDCTGLAEVTFEAGVASIGAAAFISCENLRRVFFVGDAPSIGGSAFALVDPAFTVYYIKGDGGFTSPTWAGRRAIQGGQSGLFLFRINGETIEIDEYPKDQTGPVDIPSHILGKPVTGILRAAFQDCTGLTSITMPDSITTIGDWAFLRCSGLTSTTMPVNLVSIGEAAFQFCSLLSSITIPPGVIDIGDYAFASCSTLTDFTFPASVANIGNWMFVGCTNLTAISVDAGNPDFLSDGGVLFDAARSSLLQFPVGRSGVYTIPTGISVIGYGSFSWCQALTRVVIPDTVTSIEANAFRGCSGLTTITIPRSVASIGWSVFSQCGGLRSAFFRGDAPSLEFEATIFSETADGFTVHYLDGSTGFSTPEWQGYPAVMIDQALHPAGTWLLQSGFAYDTDLHQDTTGDGVSLLMAYALNLDPSLNLAGSLPVPVIGENSLSITFHATSPGITYSVETSSELGDWQTEGVTLSEPDSEGRRTASVNRDSPRRFLRLVVEE